jgi:hypothetical protein
MIKALTTAMGEATSDRGVHAIIRDCRDVGALRLRCGVLAAVASAPLHGGDVLAGGRRVGLFGTMAALT